MHEFQGQKVLACCEKKLLGKEVVLGNDVIEAKKSFFGGKEVSEKELAKLMAKADSISLLGEKPVKAAIDEGLASKENVLIVAGVPHLNIFRV